MTRPQVRADLALMPGYHSAQVDVEVRLNTNEAPEPPPEEFQQQLNACMRDIAWNRYPDRMATVLRSAIAQIEQVHNAELTASNVFAANGSNEVLQTILLAYGGFGRKAMTFEPTYALHSHIAKLVGTEVISLARGADMLIDTDVAIAEIAHHRPSVVLVCSPNNPTGMVEPADTILSLVEACETYSALLVVDEAYGQFAPSSFLTRVSEEAPMVVNRTYSKTWSLAAARLGYCVGPTWLVEELYNVCLPYHVDAFKQLGGVVALDFVDEMRDRIAGMVDQRDVVAERLAAMDVQVWPSGANFILFRPNALDATDVWQRLVDLSILVRNCASWPGLENCLRVTIGTPVENQRFCDALEKIVGPQ